ncbi:hypothetical protein MSSIT_1050 [Methanosarcina siciliae T4/M]|uniref:Uncharacterized protein n=2 Tax=Methanosarcina siciliae TaxID=38027 RepID=A0A0E3PBU6_9EURY|nr:hypothetical protein MSSIT_1050 [Methanosarcina siciliae T4/M]AKB31693.1 hypothetical protein MSSIH_1003 [Methanosarcina siciliae HI350]
MVEKTKKAGSKKLYFSAQRDMLTMTINAVKSKTEVMISPAIKELPAIIERCKNSNEEGSDELLKIIEYYYQQIISLDLIYKNLVEFTEKIQNEVNKK